MRDLNNKRLYKLLWLSNRFITTWLEPGLTFSKIKIIKLIHFTLIKVYSYNYKEKSPQKINPTQQKLLFLSKTKIFSGGLSLLFPRASRSLAVSITESINLVVWLVLYMSTTYWHIIVTGQSVSKISHVTS